MKSKNTKMTNKDENIEKKKQIGKNKNDKKLIENEEQDVIDSDSEVSETNFDQADDEVSDDGNQQVKNDSKFFASTLKNLLMDSTNDDASEIVMSKRKTKELKDLEEQQREVKKIKKLKKMNRIAKEQGKVKPELAAPGNERRLRKIATRGVVMLFNAIQKHQAGKKQEDDVISKDVKELPKQKFLDILKQSSSTTPNKGGWDVLQDDYMMGAKMKDLSREEEDDTGSELEAEYEDDE